MRTCYLLFHILYLSLPILYPLSVRAQEVAYEGFEVDSVAFPRGGLPMLETFLAVNLQKPFMAQVANVTGNVFVKAVVEPNGRISNVTLVRGIRSDCDREALRVMRLFNAWKPAIKDGQPVRQIITHEVSFKANEPLAYENGYRLHYFYQNTRQDSNNPYPAFVLKIPTDTLTALPTGEAIFCRIKSDGREVEQYRAPLYKQAIPSVESGLPAQYLLGNKPKNLDWVGPIHIVDTNGSPVGMLTKELNSGQIVDLDKKGMVTTLTDRATKTRIDWYPSGLKATESVQVPDEERFGRGLGNYRILYAWDTTGQEVIRGGTGHFTFITHDVKSYKDSTQKTVFTESGAFVNGYKDGIWQGHYADNSYTYQERFENAQALGGRVTRNGIASNYEVAEESPEFEGGYRAMKAFFARNLMYPLGAQRFKKEGIIYVSFTVCTDGSLCDFNVVKGVSKPLDEEAMRVVKKMNRLWLPGTLRGEPVRVNYVLPVSFQLE